jgi:hypothetical protein
MLFTSDKLALAVAIGGEPNPLGGAQRLANRSELGALVAALCRASAVKTFGPQQDLSLSEIKSERIDGAIRQELVSAECVRRPELPAVWARPCRETDVCVHVRTK